MDTDDLLESVEADDDEPVLQFGRGRFIGVDLVQKESIQGQRLFVDDVAPSHRVRIQTTPTACRRPVLSQS